jgi:glycosyltransferase involved in cell wall biosynthesis
METKQSAVKEVTILLALYNGAINIEAQMQSFIRQSHTHWSLIISDDGSTDTGPDIIRQFCSDHPAHKITLIEGPKQGFVKNFLSLIDAADADTDFIALSDQDDVWLEDKLERAIAHLDKVEADIPALYGSRTMVCDDTLKTKSLTTLFKKPPSFQNALVQNIIGGNTMVINQSALRMLKEITQISTDTTCHDWWIYQMISGAGGTVIYDPEPSLKYRQHAGNLIGANTTTLASLARLNLILNNQFKKWNEQNISALLACKEWLTPDNRAVLDHFAAARKKTLFARLIGFYKSGVYRQSHVGNMALILASLISKV